MQKYFSLIDIYEKKEKNVEEIMILSYLYRLTDQFAKENALINGTCAKHEYFEARKAFYNQSLFNQYEPRIIQQIEPETGFAPTQEVLDNLCFVTIGSQEVYESMVQTIESVKAINEYADIPFYVVGLHNNDFPDILHDELLSRYKIKKILYPQYEHYYPDFFKEIENTTGGIQANYIYPFIDHIVPHKYICFIESDIWVNHRFCIDRLLHFARQNTFAMYSENMGIHAYTARSYFVKQWQNLTRNLCYHNKNKILNNDYVKYIHERIKALWSVGCAHPAAAEHVLMYTYDRKHYLNNIFHDQIGNYSLNNLPISKNDQLHDYKSGRLINSMHLRFSYSGQQFPHLRDSKYYRKALSETYYVPTISFEDLGKHYFKHKYYTMKWWATLDKAYLPSEYHQMSPIKFRVYPHKDKEELAKILFALYQ